MKRKPSDGRIMVSKHFHLGQFCVGRPAPNPFQVQKIFILAAVLDSHAKIRGIVPQILTIEDDFDAVTFYFAVPGVDERHTVERIEL